jgi:hypothetical protein
MNYKKRIGLYFIGVLLIGCTPKTYRLNPQFNTQCRDIRIYGLLSPDVEVCQISAGGVREIIDEWCKTGKDNVDLAMKTTLEERKISFKPIDIDTEAFQELEDIQDLYRVVSLSIRTHTYGPNTFSEKVKDFDYSVGPIDKILARKFHD